MSDARADIGPLAAVPVVGAACIQLLLAVILIVPRRMKGARRPALLWFFGILVIPWIFTLMTTTDSLRHFVPLLIAIIAAFAFMYWRAARR
jgi:hypothetical protein